MLINGNLGVGGRRVGSIEGGSRGTHEFRVFWEASGSISVEACSSCAFFPEHGP